MSSLIRLPLDQLVVACAFLNDTNIIDTRCVKGGLWTAWDSDEFGFEYN